MKGIFALLFVICLTFVYCAEEDVLVLTDSNFDEIINSEPFVLVEFYAPWCGHCKKLAPNYAEAAGILKKSNPEVKLAKVDCTVETKVASRFGVTGYPTLKVFRNGNPSEYKGTRETPGIVSYMKNNAGPSAKPLTSIEDAKKFISYAGDISVVGSFPSKSTEQDLFLKAADALRSEFRFGIITDQSVMDSLGLSSGVTIFRSGEKDKVTFGGLFSTLQDWIYDTAVEVPGEITKDNVNRFLRKKLPILKLYTDVDWKSNIKQTNYWLNRLKKIAEDAFKGKLLFAIADKTAFAEAVQKFGLSTFPAVGIDDATNSQKYRHTGEFSIANVVQFAKEYLEGKVKSYIKSEPTPTQDGPVTIVTGDNFKDIVLDPTKDVLLEMYAPWCGHCKNLVPIYDELATNLKNVENIVIAKMDATANDSPHGKYQAKGYPTILFAPANNKDAPIAYNGGRDVQSFTDFLKKESSSWKETKTEL